MRQQFAADALRVMSRLSDQMTEIRGREGALTGDSKQRVLAVIENLRRIVLKWPAWAAPATVIPEAASAKPAMEKRLYLSPPVIILMPGKPEISRLISGLAG